MLTFFLSNRSVRSLFLGAWIVGLLFASPFANRANAEEPPTSPLLRIETKMHIAMIKELAVNQEETFFATCSYDGTVRIWDLASGDLQKTIRVPFGPGDGQLYSLAISPDGKLIATGGSSGFSWDGTVCIYLIDRQSGKIIRRFKGLPNSTQIMRFSPDGKHLAVGIASTDGLRVFRVADGVQIAEDKEYGGDCLGMSFRSDGVLATSAQDGFLRLYTPDFKLAVRQKAPGGTHPHGIAYTPDGTGIAVGYGDTKNVNVVSGNDLKPLYSPQTDDIKVPFAAFDVVAWSPDGKQLFAGGRAAIIEGETATRIIRRWDKEGKGKPVDIGASSQTITALVPLKLGATLYATADPLWGVLEGDKVRRFEAPTIDLVNTTFMMSEDGATIQYAAHAGDKETLRFNLNGRKLDLKIAEGEEAALKKGKEDGFHVAVTEAPGLKITDWENGMHPKVNGHAITLLPNETTRCIAIMPDKKRFLIGSDFTLQMIDSEGKQLWVVSVAATIWHINVSTNGKIGAILSSDGTARWFTTEDSKPLVALFIHYDQKQWVAWTQKGYYDAAVGSEDLIGWHINRGKEQEADFFPASRFRAAFYRPDVIERMIPAGGEAEAVRLADADRGRKTEVVEVNKTLPPLVTIKSPENNVEVSKPSLKVEFAVRTPSDAPVTAVRALVDGRPIGGTKRIQEVDSKTAPETAQSLDVPLPPRDCEITIIAENKHGASAPITLKVRWKGTVEEVIKPKLYLLAIGVSKYKNPEYTLNFAAKDASDFAEVMKKQSGKLYRDVEMRVLTDDAASKEATLDGLEWIQKQTTSRDVAMIFLSGHGVQDGSGDYYYVPYNFDMGRKRSTGVLFYEIEKTIKDIAGKVVFFVDTCHSGGASGKTKAIGSDIGSIVNELSSAENGAIVFSASTGKEFALEDEKWGHGAFTKALLEGLDGKADLKGDGRITITGLDYFLSERVKELTGGSQHPTTAKPPSVPNFPIAISK